MFDEAFPVKQRKIISPTEDGRRHDPFEYHSEEEFKLPDINISKRARQKLVSEEKILTLRRPKTINVKSCF